MNVHSEEQNTWYMKVIWKILYKFAEAKINWLTWWYTSRFTRHCTLNISYRERRHIFSVLLFYKQFLPLVHVAFMQDMLKKSSTEIFYGLIWFGSVKQIDLLSILLPSEHSKTFMTEIFFKIINRLSQCY